MSVPLTFRLASVEDTAAILRIYAQYIDTGITFETVLPSQTEFAERIRTTASEFPYLVCERGGQLVGYAYAHRKFERAAYQWTAELSVYLDSAVRGQGIGAMLYARLLRLLRAQNYQLAFAVVTAPNPASERFHEKLGFLRRSEMPDVSFKNGCWYGIIWYEMRLLPKSIPPAPILPFPALDGAFVQAVLENPKQ